MSTSTKPYLLRAIFDWCVDGGFTPYVAVQVDTRTRVPIQHVRDGQIVLNIAPYATNQLLIDDEALSCQARFSGKVESLYVPITQVLAIYARENGQGMAFQPGMLAGSAMELGGLVEADAAAADLAVTGEEMPQQDEPEGTDPAPATPAPAKGGHLRRIK